MAAAATQFPTLTPHPQKKGSNIHLTSGRHCIAAGNGLMGGVAGVASVVAVSAKDARGEKRPKGGDVVLVYMREAGGAESNAHVIDNTDGTYTCTYLPTVASPYCDVTVTVNGTHVVGSPFPATVVPGRTDAQASEVFGHGLTDGVSGEKNIFTILTKDPYGNSCKALPDQKDTFAISIKPVHSLLPELSNFMSKYEVNPVIQDNENGTHTVEWTADYAGFYTVDVTFGNVPVGDSPYTACICNPTIAFPTKIGFEPVHPLPEAHHKALLEAQACDMVQLHDMLVLLKSKPIALTNNRREREYLHYYRITSAMARGKEQWGVLTLRGAMMPPPLRRECLALDQKLLCLSHSDDDPDEDSQCGGRTTLNSLRMLDLSDLNAKVLWEEVAIDNHKQPNAVEGCSVCLFKDETYPSILVVGGVDAAGQCVNDIYKLPLSLAPGEPKPTWLCLQEWPSSVFSGKSFTERCNFSLTNREGTGVFYIFGGRGQKGELLNDLYSFEMGEEPRWSTPQVLNDPPLAREHHASCFVADRYLLIYGGIDADGVMLNSASVYDIHTSLWMTVEDVEPRAMHRLINRGGVMYLLGGITGEGEAAPADPTPLQSQVFPFTQTSSFDFVNNNAHALVVKPSPQLTALRQHLTVEAVFFLRSCSNAQSPVIVKSDNGLKSGFGIMCQEHPAFKGDAEEGWWVHFFIGAWTSQGPQLVGCKIERDTWIHVAATFNGHEIKLFKNGSLQDSKSEYVVTDEEAETLHSKGDLFIGGMPGKYSFDGFIDECRVWDVARNDDDMKTYMNKPVTERAPNLIGQWTFNEGAGDLVIDSSSSRNHASFDRYAGGVELRRVQSKRPFLEAHKSEREKHIDANFEQLQKWKDEFEKNNGRQPTKAEIMMNKDIYDLARRLGEFGID